MDWLSKTPHLKRLWGFAFLVFGHCIESYGSLQLIMGYQEFLAHNLS